MSRLSFGPTWAQGKTPVESEKSSPVTHSLPGHIRLWLDIMYNQRQVPFCDVEIVGLSKFEKLQRWGLVMWDIIRVRRYVLHQRHLLRSGDGLAKMNCCYFPSSTILPPYLTSENQATLSIEMSSSLLFRSEKSGKHAAFARLMKSTWWKPHRLCPAKRQERPIESLPSTEPLPFELRVAVFKAAGHRGSCEYGWEFLGVPVAFCFVYFIPFQGHLFLKHKRVSCHCSKMGASWGDHAFPTSRWWTSNLLRGFQSHLSRHLWQVKDERFLNGLECIVIS